jgi:hypothetical protein
MEPPPTSADPDHHVQSEQTSLCNKLENTQAELRSSGKTLSTVQHNLIFHLPSRIAACPPSFCPFPAGRFSSFVLLEIVVLGGHNGDHSDS